MRLLTGRVLVVLAVLSMTVSVGGAETGDSIVLSKPFDQNISSNVTSEADAQQIADNFKLETDETIGEITWYGGFGSSDIAKVDRLFILRIFDDSKGTPDSIIYKDMVSVTDVNTGTKNNDGNDIFKYTAVIDPVDLKVGTDYWLSVLENDPATATGNWFWQASTPVGGENIGQRFNDVDPWSTTADPTRNEMAFSLGAAESIPEPTTDLDYYLSHKVKRTKDTPKFEKLKVTLTDQFESDVLFEVKKPKEIYNPADKKGEGIFDPDTHLVAYEIKRAKTKPRQPKHVKQTNIEVVNQFGTIFVDTKKPDRLLVPSLKDLDTAIPDMDLPDEFPVDYFKCYKVKVSEGSEFTEGIQVTVGDQFTDPPEVFEVGRPERLCNPVDIGEGIQYPDDQLLCYKIRQVNFNGIHVNNQFGPLQLDLEKKEAELCVPSTNQINP